MDMGEGKVKKCVYPRNMRLKPKKYCIFAKVFFLEFRIL